MFYPRILLQEIQMCIVFVIAVCMSKQLTILDILSIRRLREAFACVEYVFSHYLSVFGSYDIIPMMRSICSIGCPLHGTDALFFPEFIMLERVYLMTVQKFTVYETLEKFKMPTVFAV